MVDHVVSSVEAAGWNRICVVVGYQGERVHEALSGRALEYAWQREQLGTGHAVQMARSFLQESLAMAVVLAGDVPLIRPETLSALVNGHQQSGAAVTILTAELPDAGGYGRIIRDDSGKVTAIVEDKDCTSEQLEVREINSGILAFNVPFLLDALDKLNCDNEQNEYYLTDTVKLAFDAGLGVEGVLVSGFTELAGINTREQLEEAALVLQSRTS